MPKLPRAILAIPIWLAIGAAITVAASWAIAAWMPLRAIDRVDFAHYKGDPSWSALGMHCFRGFGWQRRAWDFYPANGIPRIELADAWIQDCVGNEATLKYNAQDEPMSLSWLRWGQAEQVWTNPASDSWWGSDHASGWPIAALWYEYASVASLGIQTRGAIALTPQKPFRGPAKDMRALPYRPIWTGLVIDSAFWAGIAWLFSGRLQKTRRAARLRRNHCPHCNYDLSASPTTCSECGRNRTRAINAFNPNLTSPMPPIIRPFTPADLPFISQTLIRAFASTQIWSRRQCFEAMDLPALIADDRGTPIGLSIYRIDHNNRATGGSPETPVRTPHIPGLASNPPADGGPPTPVQPPHPTDNSVPSARVSAEPATRATTELELLCLVATSHHQGTGSFLLEATRILAINLSCRRLFLTTTNDNLDALRFYQRRGMKLAALHPGAMDHARQHNPAIPERGHYNIPMRDDIELEYAL